MPGKWDGKSRIPTQLYKDNYNRIFGKKDDKRKKFFHFFTTPTLESELSTILTLPFTFFLSPFFLMFRPY